MSKQRVCRNCGRTFQTSNSSAQCSSCLYARQRLLGEPCPVCGQAKDRRAATCIGCRPGKSTPKPASARGPRFTADEVIARETGRATPDGDCLLVTALKPQPKGYIRVASVDERSSGQMLHRLIAERQLGRRLAREESVDHTCHNADRSCPGGASCRHRRCINPDHLEVIDPVTNWSRGRLGAVARRRALTHCPNGHPYTGANLRSGTSGRACKACHRARRSGRDPEEEPTYLR